MGMRAQTFNYHQNRVTYKSIYNNLEYDQIIEISLYLKYIVPYCRSFVLTPSTKQVMDKGQVVERSVVKAFVQTF